MDLRLNRCLRDSAALVLLVALMTTAAHATQLPRVLQPNTTSFSVDQVGVLGGALSQLETALALPTYASRKTLGDGSWGTWTSAQLATYTAGVLSGSGYETRLASAPGWPDGVHTWVLVAVSLGEHVTWIPVEACPEPGSPQLVLGTVPQRIDAQGVPWFEERYLGFADAAEVPANLPPIARITTRKSSVSTTNWTMLMGGASYDPDGAILLYVWDFGDGEAPSSTTTYYISHRFSTSGTYEVSLTVVDQQGAMATATITLESAAGCGCSG
jgi:hypothetical protein